MHEANHREDRMKRHHRLLPFLGIVALTAAQLACGSSEPTAPPPTAEPGEISTPVEGPPTEALPVATEEPPQPSGPAIYALAIVDPSPPGMFYTVQPGTRLVSVELVFDNQSPDAISVNPLYATLVDDQGLVHTAELAASDDYPQIATVSLYPGERIRGWVSFAVEDGSSPARIKYELDMFTGELVEAPIGPTLSEPELAPFAPVISAPRLGDVSTVAGYSLSADEVVDPAPPSSFFSPDTGYHLVSVRIFLRNESATDPLSVNPLYCFLVDNHGFVYAAELGSSDLGQIDTVDIATGEAARGYVSFQVPDDRTPLYVRYSTDFWEAGEPLVAGLVQ
jgi:hypothetical protein